MISQCLDFLLLTNNNQGVPYRITCNGVLSEKSMKVSSDKGLQCRHLGPNSQFYRACLNMCSHINKVKYKCPNRLYVAL